MYELRCGHYALGALAAVCRLLGIDEAAVLAPYREDVDLATTIDPRGAPDPLPEIAQRFDDAGLAVTMKLLANEFGLPIFGAAAVDRLGFDSISATAGYGIDGDPVSAAVAALLELAQSRATDRQGAREDCGAEEKGRLKSVPDGHWLLQPGRVAGWTESVGAATTVSVAELVRRLQRNGLRRVAAVELPAPLGLAAVRALVPEAETWHATAGHSRLGVRASRRLALRAISVDGEERCSGARVLSRSRASTGCASWPGR
jgi:ribosomal protein S12 methylthiotransferase accessory factor